MNTGFPPPLPPDDEAADPLLTALRQRLGDYGQAPPPGAWAAIRQRVSPPPPPPPWWRRRHLLAVLGLLLCCLLPGKLSEWTELRRANETAASRLKTAKNAASRPTLTTIPDTRATSHSESSSTAPVGLANRRPTPSAAKVSEASASLSQATKTTAASLPTHATGPTAPQSTTAKTILNSSIGASVVTSHSGRPHHNEANPISSTGTKAASHPSGKRPHSTSGLDIVYYARTRRHSRGSSAELAKARAADGRSTSTTVATATSNVSPAKRARHTRLATATSRQAISLGVVSGTATRASVDDAVAARLRARAAKQVLGNLPSATSPDDASAATADEAARTGNQAAFLPGLYPSGPLDLLASKLPGQLAVPKTPLAPLVARPDSAAAAPLARHWSLLVLAGPTVSYRTLGLAPTLAAGHPDFARLERPALGLGAQVQVRRVLSGRWALAVGVGYHEYATRLALSLKDSAYASIRQRDTYRLLTVPVQLSYALGVPKSRLSKALLLGFEPGWYLGGRSTEGSGCGCEQQVYTSASSSPYRPLSVAFSLGLDLRYRLGSSGSRWQWLVQPTGRYVATPFVHSDAIGFTRRQPFSLGLLTGFSWDVR